MNKILLVSNSPRFSQEINSALSEKFELSVLNYAVEDICAHINTCSTDLILMHFQALTGEDVICFHKIIKNPALSSIPKVFIGDELDYRDHVSTWGGNFSGTILTPVNLGELFEKIDQFFNQKILTST